MLTMDNAIANATFVIDDIWSQNSRTRREKSLKLLTKVYNNIKNHPNEAKYRRLNIAKIASKPAIIPQVRQLLLSSGFKININGIYIDLDDNKVNLCINVGNILQQKIDDENKKLDEERQKIKQQTKIKTENYISKSNRKKSEVMKRIQNEKKDIQKLKALNFKTVQESKSKKIKKVNVNLRVAENKNRLNWKLGSKCQIYLNSQNKWINGVVTNISTGNDKEWLTVKYNAFETKNVERNSNDIRQIPKIQSNFVKNPEITCRNYNLIIEHWYRLTDYMEVLSINRLIIAFCLDAYRLVLAKDNTYLQKRMNNYYGGYAGNRDRNKDKIIHHRMKAEYERETFYQSLKNNIYQTKNDYNETKLPQPVSGINFEKEFVLLITNKHFGAEFVRDYEINNDGKCITFTMRNDFVNNYSQPHNSQHFNSMLQGNQANYIWCVAVPNFFKFDKIGIKTVIKRIKSKLDDENDDINQPAMPPGPGPHFGNIFRSQPPSVQPANPMIGGGLNAMQPIHPSQAMLPMNNNPIYGQPPMPDDVISDDGNYDYDDDDDYDRYDRYNPYNQRGDMGRENMDNVETETIENVEYIAVSYKENANKK